MRKRFLPLAAFALVCLFSATASATANYVYHEQTNNFVATPVDDPGDGCGGAGTNTSCGRYVENTDRSAAGRFQIYSPETYSLRYKVEYQDYTNLVAVYYTTDGSAPSGSRGTPHGTTHVVTASYTCTFSDSSHGCQTVDVVSASIPPQAAGTTVKYIVSAWHFGGGDEIFANSGACDGCGACADSKTGCATVFEYDVLALPPTPLIISEFRLRGPGADGVVPSADDDDDEFVEIYNNSDSDVLVNAYDGSGGFAVAASDGLTRFTITNGTTIPARGHYLGVNSVGYSLGAYASASRPETFDGAGDGGAPTYASAVAPSAKSRLKGKAASPNVPRSDVRRGAPTAGGAAASQQDEVPVPAAATGDKTFTDPIADNAGIALFNTSNPANFSLATRLDAVGSTSEANALYKEGAGYPAIVPVSIQHSFFRDMCGKGGSVSVFGNCPNGGFLSDTGENGTDFVYTDTTGTNAGAGARLGAPGPENRMSPVQRNSRMPGSLISPCVSSSAPPNRERTFTRDTANNSTFGTLSIRRRITNSTTANVTRLRFRVIDISTFPSPAGTADLRVRSSSLITVDDPCTSLPVVVNGTTLEEPPAQPSGGGFNSSLSAGTVTLLTPILPGNTFDFHFLLGIQRTGRFKFYVNVEVLP
ncbi:MAG TPA: hypothetical protein VF570_08400 [Pyrinomonadaceae bacterium]